MPDEASIILDVGSSRPLARSGLAPGEFRMWRVGYAFEDDPWALWSLLGDRRPQPIRGYGGWGQAPREGRRAVSTVTGTETPAYSIKVQLDRTRPGGRGGVDDQRRNLEKLCGWNRADDTPPPRVCWIANVAHDYTDAPRTEWGCETLEWEEENSSDRGTQLWQMATFTLAVIDDTTLPAMGKSRGFRTHTLPKGRDLRWFARRYLGKAARWADVATLNRDNAKCPQSPSYPVKRDVELLVPPREQ